MSSGSQRTGKPPRRQGTRRRLRDNPRYVLTRLLAVRPRSVTEARARLLRKGFAQSDVEQVLQEFVAHSLLDDRAFAAALLDAVLRRAPAGQQFMRARLRRAGIADDIMEDVLATHLPPARERALARELFERKLQELLRYHPSSRNLKLRAAQFLRSRGFPADIVLDCIDEVRTGDEAF